MNYKRKSRRRDKRVLLRCGCCEDISRKTRAAVVESEICNGKSNKKKRNRKPKERCLPGMRHEWYKEWVEEPWHWSIEPRKIRVHKKTCINCWIVKRIDTEYPWRQSWRKSKKKVLPKRPVQF